MGNYQFAVRQFPKKGSIMLLVDNDYTRSHGVPSSVMYQGSQVRIIGSQNLMSSDPNSPVVSCTLVEFPNGFQEVVFTTNLKQMGA